jgi:hypothetical protein
MSQPSAYEAARQQVSVIKSRKDRLEIIMEILAEEDSDSLLPLESDLRNPAIPSSQIAKILREMGYSIADNTLNTRRNERYL